MRMDQFNRAAEIISDINRLRSQLENIKSTVRVTCLNRDNMELFSTGLVSLVEITKTNIRADLQKELDRAFIDFEAL